MSGPAMFMLATTHFDHCVNLDQESLRGLFESSLKFG